MLEKKVKLSHFEDSQRTSKMGYNFDVTKRTWKLDTSVTLNWGLLPNDCALSFLAGYKEQMADYACELSASSCSIIFQEILAMLRKTNGDSLKLSTVQNYLGELDSTTEYKLGSIRAFLLNWHDKEIEGIDPKLAPWLEQITLKGIAKGVPVAKGCPHTGAYSMQEQQAILFWGVNAFFDDKMSLRDYTWLLLNVYLGARPTQFCQLKACDLVMKLNNDRTEFTLNLPQAKKHGSTNFREVMKESDIDEDLALLFSNQASKTLDMIEAQVGKLPEELKAQMPVFGFAKTIKSLSSISQLIQIMNKTPDAIHLPRRSSTKILFQISKKCMAKSERLDGEFIHLTARRFRYTMGTNAARRGLSAFAIAKILGHNDIQNVKVYTENVKELTEEINEALAPVLAPLAQAFAGTLIASEAEALRANDPHSRIRNQKGEGVGNCGTYGFCAKGGRACYTCVKFQPWVTGRHQVILDGVLEERKRLSERGASKFVIQSTDRLVLAITEVIQLCAEVNKNEGVVNE
jgi:integrase